MRLLYGTTNEAKIEHMRQMLILLNLDIIGLKDINVQVGEIDESGNNPLENARIKAMAYYTKTKMPVFSCDSGLYIEGLTENEQPGVHIRRVNGKILNDEEMIVHYSSIASRFGGLVKAKYKNAICFVIGDKSVFDYDGVDIASEYFYISNKVHEKRISGFPLDSISIEPNTQKHYFDLQKFDRNKNYNQANGFRRFFIRALELSAGQPKVTCNFR